MKKYLNTMLAVIDIALLIVIVISYQGAKKENSKVEKTPNEEVIVTKPDNKDPQTNQNEQNLEDPLALVEGFSTSQRPSELDFAGWYVQDVMVNGLPENRKPITDFRQILGGWKGFIYYDPNDEANSRAVEYLNVDISGTPGVAAILLDWYMMVPSYSEYYYEEDVDDLVMMGSYEDGELSFHDAGDLYISNFYEKDGKQYAVGYMETKDGIPAFVALVRP